MDTYFSRSPSSAESFFEFSLEYGGEAFSWISAPGIFQRKGLDVGTSLLLDCIARLPGKRILDIGCGHGPLGLLHLRRQSSARAWLVDVNERACRVALCNARRLKLPASVIQGEIAHCFPAGFFDLVLTNPPIRAGLEVLRAFWADSARVLQSGGSLVFVCRPKQGGRRLAQMAAETLQAKAPEKLGRKKGFEVFRVVRG
jgi:16S rRNA (guanine1207-N2)-methyltransferase